MRAESEMVSASVAEKDEGLIDLRFRNVMVRFCLTRGIGMSISTVMARWSEIVRSMLVRLVMVMPEVQTRSSVCPCLWVGKSTCWVMLKQCRMSKSSADVLQLESAWILKSPNNRTDGVMAQS